LLMKKPPVKVPRVCAAGWGRWREQRPECC